MNRRERRAQRSQQRSHQRRASPLGYEMKRMGKPNVAIPPAYVELTKQIILLIQKWIATEPGRPALRWIDNGDTLLIGSIAAHETHGYLADSPDAHRLLQWLDAQTKGEATLAQVTFALRFIGQLPGGPEPDAAYRSEAVKALEDFAFRKGTDTVVPPSPCGHCGRVNDHASGPAGAVPTPGTFTMCFQCLGINRFDDALLQVKVSEEEIDGMHPSYREHFDEMRAMIRQSRLSSRPPGAPKAEA
jgi:hypothetical protein